MLASIERAATRNNELNDLSAARQQMKEAGEDVSRMCHLTASGRVAIGTAPEVCVTVTPCARTAAQACAAGARIAPLMAAAGVVAATETLICEALRLRGDGCCATPSAAGYDRGDHTFSAGGGMSFWACAQLDQRRERLALDCLGLAGHVVYQPRIRAPHRTSVPLFPSYLFVAIEAQWHAVRWAPGISKVLMNGEEPARVPDRVIEELRAREGRNGLIVLPAARTSVHGVQRFESGDTVRISAGPLSGLRGLVAGMKGRQRVEILLAALGRVELAAAAVERA